jgi:type I secretion membrane fusion protein, HlyD family
MGKQSIKDTRTDVDRFGYGGRVVVGTLLSLILIGGVGGWAANARLNGAVVSTGTVEVDQKLKSVQHRDGGIVSEIAVREGDSVGVGQVLIRLDDTQVKAESEIVRAQILELAVKRARLIADRDGQDRIVLQQLPFAPDESVLDLALAGETRLLKGNRTHRESQKEQLELATQQVRDEVRGLEAQLDAKVAEIALLKTEFARVKGLAEKKLIETSRASSLERDLTRLMGEEGEISAAIARANTRENEIRLQIIGIDEASRTDAQRELVPIDTRLSELQERYTATQDRLMRTEIRAPIAGIINELNVHTLGGVISPAEILATIVPQDARLRIAVKVAPQSIDQVSVDRPARLRFTAFNQRVTPELAGRVVHISPATTRDSAAEQPYYLGEVSLDEGELAKLPEARLLPGMPVEVYISTDERTPLSYLAKPIADQFARAFTER